MKFKVTMKTPDALHSSIEDAIESVKEDEKESIIEEAESICSKWFKYGEYLTVEIDTETETCIVVPEK